MATCAVLKLYLHAQNGINRLHFLKQDAGVFHQFPSKDKVLMQRTSIKVLMQVIQNGVWVCV